MSRPIAIPSRERYSISHDEVKTRKQAGNNHAGMQRRMLSTLAVRGAARS
jgi:hypothetical protein